MVRNKRTRIHKVTGLLDVLVLVELALLGGVGLLPRPLERVRLGWQLLFLADRVFQPIQRHDLELSALLALAHCGQTCQRVCRFF